MTRVKSIPDDDDRILVKVKTLATGAILPTYKTEGAVGMDISSNEHVLIPRLQRRLIKTGLAFEIPEGYEIQVRSRSGMAANNGFFILNSPGTVDSDFRGELVLIGMNLGTAPVRITPGMRLAQLVIAPVLRMKLKVVAELSETARGDGKFGSTGQ